MPDIETAAALELHLNTTRVPAISLQQPGVKMPMPRRGDS